jgi:hypothetical protein
VKVVLLYMTKKKGALKWIFIGVMVLLIVGGYKYFSLRKEMEARRAEMQEQRQVMIDFYKDQGLSDEEIEEKMQEERKGDMNGERQHSSIFMIRKSLGGSPLRK